MYEPARQMKPVDTARCASAILLRGALLLGALLLLGGCVATVGYPSPYYEASSAVDISQPPPPLPDDAQPPCPGEGYLWAPGYWAYSGGYYWVPGSWVLPPRVGLLWTPGYWGFSGGAYVWHAGYWGPHVGFYGGVRYGFGYDGRGYVGGRWDGPHFVYNRYVTNVDVRRVPYTYDERVHRRFDADRVSYDGGRGGIVAYPTREDRRYAQERHFGDTFVQRTHRDQAARNQPVFARENGGRPPFAATPHPGRFQGPGMERAPGAEGFRPQFARPNDRLRPNFPSPRDGQPRASFRGRPNDQARPAYQSPPAYSDRQQAARARPPERAWSHRGPAGRPRKRAVRRQDRRPLDRRHR